MAERAEITIVPEAGTWAEKIQSRWAAGLSDAARRFRGQVGLGVDRPVVMGGHQPQMWHPGILAKAVAMRAAAGASGARSSWIVVDQDEVDPWEVRYPVRRADGHIARRVWRMDGSQRAPDSHVPASNLAAAKVVRMPKLEPGERFATAGMEGGLQRIVNAMTRRGNAASAAEQVGGVACELAAEGDGEIAIVTGMGLAATDAFAELVERMRREPERVIGSYNAAVRTHPGARMAELGPGELPLWHVARQPGTPRRRVTLSNIGILKTAELAPRALLMTGLFRWLGCELCVHGTGGAGHDGKSGYDAITTDWFRDWLGVEIAPTSLATATVRLCFGEKEVVTPEQIARARWTAHAARHRPALLDDLEGQALSGSEVATLARLKHRRDPESRRVKREAFRTLHGVLDQVRARHAGELRELDAAAARAAEHRAEAEIIADRTWAFPLYEPEQLRKLRDAIDRMFA